MRTPPPNEPRRASWLALALVLAPTGCTRAGDDGPSPAPATANDVAAPPASAKPEPVVQAPEPPASVVESPPAGWTRVELSSIVPALTGTIDLPAGLTAQAHPGGEGDADGLMVETQGIAIGPRVSGLELSTLVVPHPRFQSAAAMAQFHGQFELVSTHEFGPDHWAVVQRWRPGECMLHGWSAAAGLTCSVFKAPCDEMEQWVRICGSLRSGPTPNASAATPQSAFPPLEPAAGTVAMTVARAVARNDASMLIGTIGPEGLTIGKKKHTAASLEAALAGKTVLQVVAPSFYALGETSENLFQWNPEAPNGSTVKVWFSGGYGRQPYFQLKKTGSEWHLVKFGVEDLGEP